MTPTTIPCPVCDNTMRMVDIPNHRIYACNACSQVAQLLADGTTMPLSELLERSNLGDDRVRAAISRPHVTTVQNFIDIYESIHRMLQMDLASAAGGFRTLLAQAENRIDFAISKFSGLDIVSDEAYEGLRALREARELLSPLPPNQRGIQKEASDAPGTTKT